MKVLKDMNGSSESSMDDSIRGGETSVNVSSRVGGAGAYGSSRDKDNDVDLSSCNRGTKMDEWRKRGRVG